MQNSTSSRKFFPYVLTENWRDRQCEPGFDDTAREWLQNVERTRADSLKPSGLNKRQVNPYYKHAFGSSTNENAPFLTDPDPDNLQIFNEFNESIAPYQTTYDIAYNFDSAYQNKGPPCACLTCDNNSVDYMSTSHAAYRAPYAIPAYACSSDKSRVTDDLADPYRPALLHNT